MGEAPEIVVCGLDGVLALLEHRLHHLYNESGEKDWERFLEACGDDMPNLPLIERLNQGREAGVPVVIITGRSSSVRAQTEQWLGQWGVGYDALWMRPALDFGPAVKLKAGVIEQHYGGHKVRRLYESEQHVDVARWCGEHDIPCTLISHNQGDGESRELFELKVVKHSCEHTMLHPFYGSDEFAWEERLAQLAEVPCRLCQVEQQREERQQKAQAAKLQARSRGLPPLEGSERQVEWAETIRLNAFGAVDKVLQWMREVDAEAEREDPDHWSMVKQGIEKAIEFLEQQSEARWWIDHRQGIMNSLDGGRALLSSVAQELGYF